MGRQEGMVWSGELPRGIVYGRALPSKPLPGPKWRWATRFYMTKVSPEDKGKTASRAGGFALAQQLAYDVRRGGEGSRQRVRVFAAGFGQVGASAA